MLHSQMDWHIKYFGNSVEKEVLGLPAGILAKYLRLTELILEFGPNLGMPHTKYLKEGLIELRVKGREGIARVFFCTTEKKTIVILHVFIKKSQKIPKKEFRKALLRLKKVKENES